MKEFIFKTLSLTDPLAGLDVGSGGPVPPALVLEASNQGSTSTKFVSSTREAAAMIHLAIRQTNPTWVAWMGFKVLQGWLRLRIQCWQLLSAALPGDVSGKSAPGLPIWASKERHTPSSTLKWPSTSPTERNRLKESHGPNKAATGYSWWPLLCKEGPPLKKREPTWAKIGHKLALSHPPTLLQLPTLVQQHCMLFRTRKSIPIIVSVHEPRTRCQDLRRRTLGHLARISARSSHSLWSWPVSSYRDLQESQKLGRRSCKRCNYTETSYEHPTKVLIQARLARSTISSRSSWKSFSGDWLISSRSPADLLTRTSTRSWSRSSCAFLSSLTRFS